MVHAALKVDDKIFSHIKRIYSFAVAGLGESCTRMLKKREMMNRRVLDAT